MIPCSSDLQYMLVLNGKLPHKGGLGDLPAASQMACIGRQWGWATSWLQTGKDQTLRATGCSNRVSNSRLMARVSRRAEGPHNDARFDPIEEERGRGAVVLESRSW